MNSSGHPENVYAKSLAKVEKDSFGTGAIDVLANAPPNKKAGELASNWSNYLQYFSALFTAIRVTR
jgi:hypothetical protein